MKVGKAANIFALDALRREGYQLAATIYLQSAVEEESTGNGALMGHLRSYRADGALIPEPEDEKLVRQCRHAMVRNRDQGHAGACAGDGVRHQRNRYGVSPGRSRTAARGRVERAHGRTPAFRGRGASDQSKSQQDRGQGLDFVGAELVPGSAAEDMLAESHHDATGERLESFMSAGYLDARAYALYDRIPTLCYGPISRDIHGIDEAVSLASLKRITTAMALFIARWPGLETAAQLRRGIVCSTGKREGS